MSFIFGIFRYRLCMSHKFQHIFIYIILNFIQKCGKGTQKKNSEENIREIKKYMHIYNSYNNDNNNVFYNMYTAKLRKSCEINSC